MSSEDKETTEGLSRRGFLKGGVLASAAALGGMVLTGCSPAESGSAGGGTGAAGDLGEAAPIAPLDPPASWDGEADLVVVGTGGGGIAASLLAREKGATVITLEKEKWYGGTTQHACAWLIFGGGSKMQNEMGYAWPEFPFNRKKFIQTIIPGYQFSINDELLGNLAEKGGAVADWMTEHGAPWTCLGVLYIPSAVIEGKQTNVLGMKGVVDHFYGLAEEAGAEFRLGTRCEGLVVEDGRVVGVMGKDSSGAELYFKANKGVVLCSGGFGMNRDMLKQYIPTAYKDAVYGGPMPFHTGECTRMALGVGADMSGFDSWSCWESAPDNGTGEWQFFWGVRQITQIPWLNFDIRGQRYNFFDYYTQPDMPEFMPGHGDTGVAATQMSRQGGRAYCVFDADFEQHLYKVSSMGPGSERRPVSPEDPVVEQDLFDTDWRVEFQRGLDRGLIKKADTLKGLAEELELDPAVMDDVVARWNKICEQGEDTELVFPYLPEWLSPVQKAPFYGAKIGGCIGKTLCGLRVDPSLRVLDKKGEAIPGLYANYTTAGGVVGESSYGGALYNTSILGGNALTWVSGYMAAETALSS